MRLIDWITKAMMVFTAFCAFGMAFLILVEVVARNAGIQFYGAAEYIRNMMIIIVFLQLPFAIRAGSMLSVDIFTGALPRGARLPFLIVGYLLGFLFFAAVAYASYTPAVNAWVQGQYEGEGVVDVPAWPGRFSIVLGCGLAAFYYLVCIWEAVMRRGPQPDQPTTNHEF